MNTGLIVIGTALWLLVVMFMLAVFKGGDRD